MKIFAVLLTAIFVTCIHSGRTEAAVGDVLNIQLGGSSSVSATYSNGAAINDESQLWNRLRSTNGTTVYNLKYANGASTNISVNYLTPVIGNVTTAFPSGTIDVNLMKGYLGTNDNRTGYINFSGLPTGTYNIYVYTQGRLNTPAAMQMTVTTLGYSQNFALSNNGKATTLIEGTNWMMKTIVVTDGTLNMAIEKNSLLNGVQLQQISVAAVPEPSSVALLGIGGILLSSFINLKTKENSTVNA